VRSVAFTKAPVARTGPSRRVFSRRLSARSAKCCADCDHSTSGRVATAGHEKPGLLANAQGESAAPAGAWRQSASRMPSPRLAVPACGLAHQQFEVRRRPERRRLGVFRVRQLGQGEQRIDIQLSQGSFGKVHAPRTEDVEQAFAGDPACCGSWRAGVATLRGVAWGVVGRFGDMRRPPVGCLVAAVRA